MGGPGQSLGVKRMRRSNLQVVKGGLLINFPMIPSEIHPRRFSASSLPSPVDDGAQATCGEGPVAGCLSVLDLLSLHMTGTTDSMARWGRRHLSWKPIAPS